MKNRKKESKIMIFLIIYTISFFSLVLSSFLICRNREKVLLSFCPGELSIKFADEQKRLIFSHIDKLGKKNIRKILDEIA